MIGISVLIAFASKRLLPGRATFAAVLAVLLTGGYVVVGYQAYKAARSTAGMEAQTEGFLAARTGGSDGAGLPIVVADPHAHALLCHYAPPGLRPRIVYLADPAASLRILGHNSVDQGMLDLVGPYFGCRVERYEPFLAAHPRFFLYGSTTNYLNWLFYRLPTSGRRIEFIERNGDYLLFRVETAPPAARHARVGSLTNDLL